MLPDICKTILLETYLNDRKNFGNGIWSRKGHFTNDWKPTLLNRSSYDHEIELSWYMIEAAEVLGVVGVPQIKRTSLALVNHALQNGFNWRKGGIEDEGPTPWLSPQRQKVWWVQAEGLVSFLNAYQLTQEGSSPQN